MRKFLLAVVAIAVMGLGFGANAQVPYVAVSFDDYGKVWSRRCPPAVGLDTLTVWAFNFNMWMNAIEYQIDYSSALAFLGDLLDYSEVLYIGNSIEGISIAYMVPGNAWGPFVTQRTSVYWYCDDCYGFEDNRVIVLPHPASGKIRAVSWPDLTVVEGVGYTSIICPYG